MKKSIATLCCGLLALAATAVAKPKAIVLFYADDLGYNDTSAYGCGKVPCPNLDKLAAQGLTFTDAHSVASVCTPSRYSILTGQYAWRKKGTGILPGDAKLILPTTEEAPTLPEMMRRAGYQTAAIGKWHLGLGRGEAPVDWNSHISPGPAEVGFDYSFIMAATADRVPCVFVRDGEVVNLDPQDPIQVDYRKPFPGEKTADTDPELLKAWGRPDDPQHADTIVDGISRIGHMTGGTAALWKDQDLADTLTEEAVNYIKACSGAPFFLYFCTNDIHVPRDPHARFRGKSELGIRGDVTVQMDDALGRIQAALTEAGYKPEETLIIFTSDNGPVISDGYLDGADKDCAGHNPAAPYSGGKYTLQEGGTRVPFIVSWPGHVPAGERTGALISQVDLVRTLSTMVGVSIPEGQCEDSQNQAYALLGRDPVGRNWLVSQTNGGEKLALRVRNMKLIPGKEDLLYDLKTDIEEKHNIAAECPDIVKGMKRVLEEVQEAKYLNNEQQLRTFQVEEDIRWHNRLSAVKQAEHVVIQVVLTDFFGRRGHQQEVRQMTLSAEDTKAVKELLLTKLNKNGIMRRSDLTEEIRTDIVFATSTGRVLLRMALQDLLVRFGDGEEDDMHLLSNAAVKELEAHLPTEQMKAAEEELEKLAK